MARKTVEITLEDRGNKLDFIIEEMPATRLEAWVIRALLLVAGAGVEVPQGADISKAGAYLAERGLSALGSVDYEKARPLLDELLGCCSRKLGGVKERCTPDTIDGYIEDVRTLFALRMEAIKINLGFLGAEAGAISNFREKLNTGTP